MIELDQRYLRESDLRKLFSEVVPLLPKPLAKELNRVELESRSTDRLAGFCLSVVPMTFQYLALILSGEYLASKHKRDYDLVDSLWNMVRKPGPGKWVDFIRQSTRYFLATEPNVLSRDALEALHTLLLSDKRPRVKVFDENPKGTKLDYVEALVNLRNRYAHNHRRTGGRAEELFADYFQIYRAVLILARPAFEVLPLILDAEGKSYRSIAGRKTDQVQLRPEDVKGSMALWNQKTGKYLHLFPLLLPILEKGPTEAVFLEEVKGKNLLYPYRDELIRRSGEEFRQLITLIAARTPETRPLTSEELTVTLLGERIDRLTKRTLTDFQDSLKYIREVYLERKEVESQLNHWVESAPDKSGCILVGEPGTGKTSVVAHWCEHRREANDHVLLLEASKLESSDIQHLIENKLKFSADLTLSDCFELVKRQAKAANTESASRRFIIVVEAMNEYIGSGISDNRAHLWREVNSLIKMLDAYRPYFKCLVSTRSDVWPTDFPNKEVLSEKLSRSQYFGKEYTKEKFPVLRVGSLTDEEAKEIYENACREVPGMSPLTPYLELPRKTREVIRNPFALRLLLQAFHEEAVPKLTESRIRRHFAKRKVLEEEHKTALLFVLMERISRLRKTEISLEELLAKEGEERSHNIKTNLREKFVLRAFLKKAQNTNAESLEEIVFSRRVDSPYKKLIADGILEERAVNDDQNTEVRISFAQEKIIEIVDSEFRRRTRRSSRKWTAVLICFLLLLSGGMFLISILGDSRMPTRISNAASRMNLSLDDKAQLIGMVTELDRECLRVLFRFPAEVLVLCSVFLLVLELARPFDHLRRSGAQTDLGTHFSNKQFSWKTHNLDNLLLSSAAIITATVIVYYISNISGGDDARIEKYAQNGIVALVAALFGVLIVSRVIKIAWVAELRENIQVFFGYRTARREFYHVCIALLIVGFYVYPTVFLFSQFERGASYSLKVKATALASSAEYARLLSEDGPAAREFRDLILLDPIAIKLQEHRRSFLDVALSVVNRLVIAMGAIGTVFCLSLWLLSRPMELLLRWKLKRRYRVDNVHIG